MISKTPLIITDKNGIIIYCNEAAHNLCAAVFFGTSIEDLMCKDELDTYRSALSTALQSFSVRLSALDGADLIFDLTKERSDGVRYVHVRQKSSEIKSAISYNDIADSFAHAVSDPRLSKRRVTELYETLMPSGITFGSGSRLMLYKLSDLTAQLYERIIPNLMSVYGDVTSEEVGITDESIVYAEPYGLYLTLSAMMSAASAVSPDGGIRLLIEDRGDAVIFEASADGVKISDDPMRTFGVHYVDILYAQTLACASGYVFAYENNRGTSGASSSGKVCFTLAVKCRDYYPAYLKAKSSTASSAAILASLFPFSAKKQDHEHQ